MINTDKNKNGYQNINRLSVMKSPKRELIDKISIIIPVYNVEKYVEECLLSVINQTYNNIEIIVVIDGSNDNSEAICRRYSSLDKRNIIINQENRGLSAARSVGLKHATGKYIMFVDSDDYVDKNFCLFSYQKLKETNSDIVIFDNRNIFNFIIKHIIIIL